MDDLGNNGGDGEPARVCRDFMRNVCSRGSNCKFFHPENIQIRTEPIFCHDFQQGECLSKRKQCKFIHCSREEEELFKQTGELPESSSGSEYYDRPVRGTKNSNNGRKNRGSSSGGRGRNGFNSNRGGNGRNMDSNYMNNDNNEIPVCKDYLKGQCGRAEGRCKFRHVSVESQSYGSGGGNRRRVSSSYYDSGPETKRNHYSTDYFDFASNNPSPPPPPPQQNFYSQNQTTAYQGSNNNGYSTINQLSDMSTAITSFSTSVSSVSANNTNENNTATAAAMKALEDENFMLKRRIEELKKNVSDLIATNEYLLSQNAHFRINNMTKEVQVGQVVSMAQPIAIQNSSLSCSVAASAPGLSTITSIPTVSMTPVSSLSNHSISLAASPVVSMAQQHQPQTVYPIGAVLPPN